MNSNPTHARAPGQIWIGALAFLLPFLSLVTLFDEATPVELLKLVRADIYVKGGDYDIESLEETRWVRSWGDSVEVLAPRELREELRADAIRLARLYAQPARLPSRRLCRLRPSGRCCLSRCRARHARSKSRRCLRRR